VEGNTKENKKRTRREGRHTVEPILLLRTQQIEDQTSRGLSDLGLSPPNPKRIRTPLEPFQTFKDDPLRIVRAVRFAARFGRDFELDEEMVRAIEREEIRVRFHFLSLVFYAIDTNHILG